MNKAQLNFLFIFQALFVWLDNGTLISFHSRSQIHRSEKYLVDDLVLYYWWKSWGTVGYSQHQNSYFFFIVLNSLLQLMYWIKD